MKMRELAESRGGTLWPPAKAEGGPFIASQKRSVIGLQTADLDYGQITVIILLPCMGTRVPSIFNQITMTEKLCTTYIANSHFQAQPRPFIAGSRASSFAHPPI